MITENNPSPSAGAESFAALFEDSVAHIDQLKEGDIVSGSVIKVSRDMVIVDIGFKSEGIIPIHEFTNRSGDIAVHPGDKVDVLVESRENDQGVVMLSKEKADKLKVWDEISAACERDELIEGTVSARVKGGLAVLISGGVKAFLPGSQVDLRPVRNLDKLLGQTYKFKVIKFNKKRGNIVLSRRVILEREREQLKSATLQNLAEGQMVTGVIKNITEYGAFVDLGGIDGLLHITDMSWGRVNHPSELFSVGDEVSCKVLKYNADNERVSLGLKQTSEDPWNTASDVYSPGTKVVGKVVSLTDYGAFVELAQGIEGLIHISEMTWTKPKHPSKVLDMGEEVECVVLDIDVQAKRISLGRKQLAPDPWTVFTQKYNPGDIVRGNVRSITDYGVFVGIEEGVDGMVHKSDISWTQRINNPADLYRKGDEVEAIILSVNHDEMKVSLGIKQLFEDPWNFIPERYEEGSILEVRILTLTDMGAYAELERGVEGYIPRNAISHDLVDDMAKFIKPGEIVKAEIIMVEPSDRKITLSLRDVGDRDIDSDAMRYDSTGEKPKPARTPVTRAGATLGDVLKQKLGNLAPAAEEAPVEEAAAEAAPAEEAAVEAAPAEEAAAEAAPVEEAAAEGEAEAETETE